MLETAQGVNLFIVNTGFEKIDEYFITYISRGKSSQIDYIMVRKFEMSKVIDCKVIPAQGM